MLPGMLALASIMNYTLRRRVQHESPKQLGKTRRSWKGWKLLSCRQSGFASMCLVMATSSSSGDVFNELVIGVPSAL